MEAVQKFVGPLLENVERVIVGKRQAIEFIMVALLCEGHVLLEDVPGSASGQGGTSGSIWGSGCRFLP